MAVKTCQPSYFTGFMTGIAAVYMMKNNVKNGVYTMSEIVDPVFVWNSIQKYNAADIISISDVKTTVTLMKGKYKNWKKEN